MTGLLKRKWLFSSLLGMIFFYISIQSPWIQKWDDNFLSYLQGMHTEVGLLFFRGTTFLGDMRFIVFLMIGVSLSFIYMKKNEIVVFFLATPFICQLGYQFLKGLIMRQRPIEFMTYQAKGFSFPSGHTALATAAYLLLLYVVLQQNIISNKWRKWLIGCVVVLIMLIGFSRMYLGVHYLTDVLSGALFGFVCWWLSVHLLRIAQKKK